jgi:predicted nucleotidyltransferase component of viral defense system
MYITDRRYDMLKYKHMRLNQEKIDMVRKILGAKTETETLNKALDKVLQEDQRRIRRTKIMQQMIELRTHLNKTKENTSEWVRIARRERAKSYEIGD